MTKSGWTALGLCAFLLAGGPAWAVGKTNDFPTPARVEYVMACMSGSPRGYEYLQKCSCALDTIAEHITYEQFVDAQTIRSMQQSHNRNAIEVYGNLDIAKQPLDRFYLAEAYAELRCF